MESANKATKPDAEAQGKEETQGEERIGDARTRRRTAMAS